jgi:hypothetical protein
MKNNIYVISQQELNDIGITPDEIEEAGGMEAIAHIVWLFQNTDNYSEDDIDDAILHAIEKKKQEELLQQSFDDIYTQCDDISDTNDNTVIIQNYNDMKPSILDKEPIIISYNTSNTIQDIYEKNWGRNPHPALKLMLEAYFLDVQDIVPDDADIKEIRKTVNLLRSYIAGKELPSDAEDERLIVYARTMYKEFLETKSDYNNCPMSFLLDDMCDNLPEKYRMLAQSLPVAAILKIFAENCFYDSDTHMIEESLPEEINIKNLCDMIEKLAIICKMWQ